MRFLVCTLFFCSLAVLAVEHKSTPHGIQVAVYQGSFDPLTRGHESIILAMLSKYDVVYIVPDRSMQYKNLTSFQFRKLMVRSAAADLKAKAGNRHEVLELEEDVLKNHEAKIKVHGESGGTDMWDVLQLVVEKYKDTPNVRFINVIGADTLLWIGRDPIARKHLSASSFKNLVLHVLDRSFEKGVVKYSGYLASRGKKGVRDFFLQLQKEQGYKIVETKGGKDYINGLLVAVVENIDPPYEVSSTRVKNCLKALEGLRGAKGVPTSKELHSLTGGKAGDIVTTLVLLLSPAVIDYLHANWSEDLAALYGSGANPDDCLKTLPADKPAERKG